MAAPNRYLPARSGCVSARLADIDGDGRTDLVIVYSSLGRRLPPYPGEPSSLRRDYLAKAAFLRVVFADGKRLTIRIRGTNTTRSAGIDAAGIDAVANVNSLPGAELFVEVQHISSGATVVAYGFHAGRLEPAAANLTYGGDSGVEAGFNCVGHPPRVLQRVFTFVGPNELTRSWREADVVYAWRGAKLVPIRRQTIKHLVRLRSSETHIGRGCVGGLR